ncbi:MAG: nitrate- and nitrite sensing domain-containing protein [Candidatus Thiodiazotropha sp.]
MPLSVPYIVFVAKQLEIQELKRLKTRSSLVGIIGHMIHVLQSERGASSIYLASSGRRFESTRLDLIRESEAVEESLRNKIEAELDYASHSNAKIISLMAWVLLGLDALPELRKRVGGQRLSGSESVAAFSRLIAGLISLIFELADAAIDPDITRLLVALFNLIEGKELAGQERAMGALAFGSGQCDTPLQQRIAHLIDAQQRNFRISLEFAEESIQAKWQGMEAMPCADELQRLRNILTTAEADTPLDHNLSDGWFDCCSERITAIWSIQCEMVERLQTRCTALIAEAEKELLDSKGLLQALRESPPARAGVIDRFFDPELQVEQSLSFRPTSGEGQDGSHTVIDLLQAQSLRLANVEVELEKAKRALNERKIVERAKGILMARYDLSEDEAYKKMRTASMDKNIRLVEVAESILPLS